MLNVLFFMSYGRIICQFLLHNVMLVRHMLCPSVCLSVPLSVCVSVTSRCSVKTAKHVAVQRTVHNSEGTLDF